MSRSITRLLVVAACTLFALSSTPPLAGRQTGASSKNLALVGGMLIDGWGGPPVHHAAVVIEGNRIVASGPLSEIAIPKDATIIDTSGRTMLPGLIEAHAHLFIIG